MGRIYISIFGLRELKNKITAGQNKQQPKNTNYIDHFHQTFETWEQNIQFSFKTYTRHKVKQRIGKKQI